MSMYDTLHPLAAAQGIPDRLWMSIVQVESNFNAKAVGDNGSSFGLLQLHIGGQAPSGVPTSALFDPATNFKYGLPSIARSWNVLGSSFDNSIAWWRNFAAMSGHPGGVSGQTVTDNEAALLQSAYTKNSYGVPTGTTNLTSDTTPIASVQGNGGSVLGNIPKFMDNIGLDLLIFTIAVTVLIVGIGVIK